MSTESACVFSFAFALVLAVWQFGCWLLPQYVASDEKPAGCFHSPVRSVDLFKRYLSLLNSRLSLYGGNLALAYRYRSVIFQSECGLVTLLKRPWLKSVLFLGKNQSPTIQWSSLMCGSGWRSLTIFETTLDFSKWRLFRQHFFQKWELSDFRQPWARIIWFSTVGHTPGCLDGVWDV